MDLPVHLKNVQNNYILRPDPKRDYWTQIRVKRLKEYLRRCGDAFNILIVGATGDEDDFYAIPYSELKPILTRRFLGTGKTTKDRWIASVRDHKFSVRTCKDRIDVKKFYGNRAVLTGPATQTACDLNEAEAPERVLQATYRILRDTALARELKASYANGCQFCKRTIRLPDGRRYAEAHHIQPLGRPHNGPDVKENVLCVCPLHHVLLDYGCIRLDKAAIRCHDKHTIGQQYIDYHNKVIFSCR